MAIGDIYYRYDSKNYTNSIDIVCTEFKVIKETAKGVWIAHTFYDGVTFTWKKFILNGSKKKWACADKRSALHSFIMRKYCQIRILNNQIDQAHKALLKAEQLYNLAERESRNDR